MYRSEKMRAGYTRKMRLLFFSILTLFFLSACKGKTEEPGKKAMEEAVKEPGREAWLEEGELFLCTQADGEQSALVIAAPDGSARAVFRDSWLAEVMDGAGGAGSMSYGRLSEKDYLAVGKNFSGWDSLRENGNGWGLFRLSDMTWMAKSEPTNMVFGTYHGILRDISFGEVGYDSHLRPLFQSGFTSRRIVGEKLWSHQPEEEFLLITDMDERPEQLYTGETANQDYEGGDLANRYAGGGVPWIAKADGSRFLEIGEFIKLNGLSSVWPGGGIRIVERPCEAWMIVEYGKETEVDKSQAELKTCRALCRVDDKRILYPEWNYDWADYAGREFGLREGYLKLSAQDGSEARYLSLSTGEEVEFPVKGAEIHYRGNDIFQMKKWGICTLFDAAEKKKGYSWKEKGVIFHITGMGSSCLISTLKEDILVIDGEEMRIASDGLGAVSVLRNSRERGMIFSSREVGDTGRTWVLDPSGRLVRTIDEASLWSDGEFFLVKRDGRYLILDKNQETVEEIPLASECGEDLEPAAWAKETAEQRAWKRAGRVLGDFDSKLRQLGELPPIEQTARELLDGIVWQDHLKKQGVFRFDGERTAVWETKGKSHSVTMFGLDDSSYMFAGSDWNPSGFYDPQEDLLYVWDHGGMQTYSRKE